MCNDYVWYIVNQHHGFGIVSAGHTDTLGNFSCFSMGVSECSWLVPTWEAFERAS